MSKTKQSGVAKSQLDKFREAARELETDNDEKSFNRNLKRLAKAPPPKDKPKAEG